MSRLPETPFTGLIDYRAAVLRGGFEVGSLGLGVERRSDGSLFVLVASLVRPSFLWVDLTRPKLIHRNWLERLLLELGLSVEGRVGLFKARLLLRLCRWLLLWLWLWLLLAQAGH